MMGKKQKTNQSNKIPRFEDLNFDQIVKLMDKVEQEGFDPGTETYDERIDKILQEEGDKNLEKDSKEGRIILESSLNQQSKSQAMLKAFKSRLSDTLIVKYPQVEKIVDKKNLPSNHTKRQKVLETVALQYPGISIPVSDVLSEENATKYRESLKHVVNYHLDWGSTRGTGPEAMQFGIRGYGSHPGARYRGPDESYDVGYNIETGEFYKENWKKFK